MPRWLKQIISYIVSFVVYGLLINWKVSAILLGGIAFHECGHLYAAKYLGMKTKGFYLIPFMGGAALIAGRYQKYRHLAFVAMAGPIAGTVLTVAIYGVFLATGSAFIGSAAYWMAWLNLFNLIPLAMLDGGQLMESIVYSFSEKIGAIFLTVSYIVAMFVLWHFNPFLVGLVIFIGVQHVLGAWQRVKIIDQGLGDSLPPKPDKMNIKEVVITLATYIGTGAVLFGLMYLFSTHSINLSDFFKK